MAKLSVGDIIKVGDRLTRFKVIGEDEEGFTLKIISEKQAEKELSLLRKVNRAT